jgi:glycosyltransferase involved in cell wall biosynthesis
MNKKKVLIISHEFPPFGGGAGVVAKQYCYALNNLNCDITLVTKKQKTYNLPSNVKVIGIPSLSKLWFIPYFFYIFKMRLPLQDKILLNDIGACFIAGLFFKKETLKKSISFLHGSEPEKIFKSPKLSYKIFYFKELYERTIRNVNTIIAVSHFMKEKFIEHYNLNNKIRVIYSGLDNSFFVKENDFNTNKNIDTKEHILTVSRIEKGKGFLEMYNLFKRLIKIDEYYTWTIIGEGSFKNELKRMVILDGLNDKVIFKGKVPRLSLKNYYKKADVFLLLSNYKESFGLVYLEAQAYKCPAIGYNKFGVKEAIDHNKTGFLVENVEQCFNVLLNKEYKRLSYFGDFVHRFSPEILIKNIEKFIL